MPNQETECNGVSNDVDHANYVAFQDAIGGLCPGNLHARLRVHAVLANLVVRMNGDGTSPLFREHVAAIRDMLTFPGEFTTLQALSACRECVGDCFSKSANLNPKPLASA